MPEAGGGECRPLWRVSNRVALDGEGGLRASARWHTRGRRIVYLAESAAGALIEALVHLEVDPAAPPRHFTLFQVSVPPEVAIEPVDAAALGGHLTDLDLTRELGDQWLKSMRSPLIRVPSVLLPETFNVLFNPAHAAAAEVRAAGQYRYPWDPRLL